MDGVNAIESAVVDEYLRNALTDLRFDDDVWYLYKVYIIKIRINYYINCIQCMGGVDSVADFFYHFLYNINIIFCFYKKLKVLLSEVEKNRDKFDMCIMCGHETKLKNTEICLFHSSVYQIHTFFNVSSFVLFFLTNHTLLYPIWNTHTIKGEPPL